ncbi:hypothetical protein [Actinoplanes sp. NBRC 103695]|uniref:hypothetical protein n=1 Tax=Actinoplanes sp. NBRC 103695 TaxID=3032202 RepID=UPI0024A1EA5F|nr:hypothetical protein [Actinoplanes sp. NBRC 103695]GLY95395.1 hypothetical protein Acsp02_26500 [Actinoplanes sp. NBRC 103695]
MIFVNEAMARERIGEVAAAVRTLWEVPHAGRGEWSDDLDFARRLTSSPGRPAE